MKIVVIGGTGLIGSKTVAELSVLGHEAIAAAPSTGPCGITHWTMPSTKSCPMS